MVDDGTLRIGGCQLEAVAGIEVHRRFEFVDFDVDLIGIASHLLRSVVDGESAIGAIELLFCDLESQRFLKCGLGFRTEHRVSRLHVVGYVVPRRYLDNDGSRTLEGSRRDETHLKLCSRSTNLFSFRFELYPIIVNVS